MGGFANMASVNAYARFNQLHFTRYLNALNKTVSIVKMEKNDLPHRNAIRFSHLIVANISTQKYAAGYAPLNPRYREWKSQYGRSGKEFWALFNKLIGRVAAFKVAGGWMGGIEAGEMTGGTSWYGRGDYGHSVDIGEYARFLEFGRSRQPARPLFQPTTVEYWRDGFVKEGIQSLRKVKGGWK